MASPQLALVHNVEVVSPPIPFFHLLANHHAILQGYLDTHVTRNHSDRTIESERRCSLKNNRSHRMFLCLKSGSGVK